MKNPLVLKAALVALTFCVLLIPLAMIGGIVGERAARQQAVVQEIAASSYGRQSFAGPILSIPYTEEFEELVKTEKAATRVKRSYERTLLMFPHSSEMEGAAAVSTKRRGLFKARVFNWKASVRGVYLGAVLGGAKRGLAFAAMLAVLYASLYGLLVSEDNALLLGAGLVFGVLAAAMLLTRKVDWYRGGGSAGDKTDMHVV